MIISSLRTTAFRNLSDAIVETAAKNIFLVGENGQGKTNFLEALYFCAYASSFRRVHDSAIVRNDQKDFSAEINIINQHNVLIKFESGKKNIFLNGKKVEDRKDILSVIPCIVFCHEDMEFVAGSPERQRWFFDQVLSLYDPVYLDDLRCYRRVLKSRNSVLKDYAMHKISGSPETLLDTLDQQYVLYGIRLMEKRDTAARLFSEIFAALYEAVSGVDGVTVQYQPSWKMGDGEEAALYLRKRRDAEMAAGISLSGPHRDRYGYFRCGADFAGTASTGQRRLLALLLRVAQARRFSEMTGKNPILLLDDVLLEMDGEKRRRFIAALPDYDQAFYTFLPEEPFQHYRGADTLVYHVKNGEMKSEE